MSGEKQIELGKTHLVIPEATDGTVTIGNTQLPYTEFLRGVMWGITFWSGRKYTSENPGYEKVLGIALDNLYNNLLEKMPETLQQSE